MDATAARRVFLPGKGEVTLQAHEHLATGGEGLVYLRQGLAYKLFLDAAAARARGMAGKIRLLAGLRHPYVVAPIDVLLDERQALIGYYMPAAAGVPLAKVCTRTWRDANGFGDGEAIRLVDNMRRAVIEVHAHQALMVDGNETNWLVQGVEPRVIDVDSWQIGPFPATAIMASIRDPRATQPGEGADWFAWAIVSFQVFTGIHPYKGSHPDFKRGDVEARMRAGVSVFDPRVRLNGAVRDFSVIPAVLLDWYRAVFERGERGAPPSTSGEAAARVSAPAMPPPTPAPAGMLRHEHWLTLPGTVRAILDGGFAVLDVGDDIIAFDMISRQRIAGLGHGDAARLLTGEACLARLDAGLVLLKIAERTVHGRLVGGEREPRPAATDLAPLPCSAHRLLTFGGRVFALDDDSDAGLIELALDRMGERALLAVRHSWPVRTRATRFFDGFGVMDCLGAPFVVMPEDAGALAIHRAPALQGYRLVSGHARSRHGILAHAIRRHDGQLCRLRLRLDGGQYECVEETAADDAELDVATNARGIGVAILEDGEVSVWNDADGRQTRIADAGASRAWRLFALAEGIFYHVGREVFRLRMAS